MANAAEEYACTHLNRVLKSSEVGAHIADSEDLRRALAGLAALLPRVFNSEIPELQNEGLDALYPVNIHKTSAQECEMFGQALMLSNQTLQPIFIVVQLNEMGDQITSLECKLGVLQNNKHGYSELHAISKKLYVLGSKSDFISWSKKAKYSRVTGIRD